MAMGKRKSQRQAALFVATDELARSPGHPFYQKLNRLLAAAQFDTWLERRCQQYYETEEKRGKPSIPPGVYFRMLLVGFFEGIDSQRGIAWRCHDSRSLAEFLGYGPTDATPDHSTLTNTRQRLPLEVCQEVFQFVLRLADQHGLLRGRTVGVDSTTLEANAAMKSIVRRDTGEDWQAYVTRLMREEGVIDAEHEPTAEEVRRFDKARKNKRVSNDEWKSATDEDARIAQLKDGRTHLAYKAEHVVDLETDLILAAEICPANDGDAQTLVDSVLSAQANLQAAESDAKIAEVVADKGYHSAETIELATSLQIRTYIPEPQRPHDRSWKDKPAGQQRAVNENRRRMKRDKGKQLSRRRSEKVERSFAHVCDTGGARRSWLRGEADVSKRYVIAAAGRNLSRIMRKLYGNGKPRGLQGLRALFCLVQLYIRWLMATLKRSTERCGHTSAFAMRSSESRRKSLISTGC